MHIMFHKQNLSEIEQHDDHAVDFKPLRAHRGRERRIICFKEAKRTHLMTVLKTYAFILSRLKTYALILGET